MAPGIPGVHKRNSAAINVGDAVSNPPLASLQVARKSLIYFNQADIIKCQVSFL